MYPDNFTFGQNRPVQIKMSMDRNKQLDMIMRGDCEGPEAICMVRNSSPAGGEPVRFRKEKKTLLECINKVLAGQFIRSVRSRVSRGGILDTSSGARQGQDVTVSSSLSLITSVDSIASSSVLDR